MRTTTTSKGRTAPSAILLAQLNPHVALDVSTNGEVVARIGQDFIELGQFSTSEANRIRALPTGLLLDSGEGADDSSNTQFDVLLRRLAGHGLLEYRLSFPQKGANAVVIEPQVPDYWPRLPHINDTDVLVLSRFAYMRRRATDLVLESPRAGALFKICDAKIAAILTMLSAPHLFKHLRCHDDFLGTEVLSLLVDCQILLKIDPASSSNLRLAEGADDLVLWDFHDLLFHARSTVGRHANAAGGLYAYADAISPRPAVRPSWPGKEIDLTETLIDEPASFAKLLRLRHSTRAFDDENPITLAEVSRFLNGVARVQSKWTDNLEYSGDGPAVDYAARPYPSGGASYELELYLGVNKCEGLDRGFYHYDAEKHALLPINVHAHEFEALLTEAAFAMAAQASPQILITIAARFGRVAWKYSSLAYGLILKDVGVLMQTLYLMATDMGLGGCAIGSTDIELFAKITGLEFNIEGAVGQFAIGRAVKANARDLRNEPSA